MYSSFSNSSPVKALPAPLALPFSPCPEFAKKGIRSNGDRTNRKMGIYYGTYQDSLCFDLGILRIMGTKIRIHIKKTNASTMKHEDFLLIPKTIDLNIRNGTCESIVRISPTRPGSHQDGQDTESVWWFFLFAVNNRDYINLYNKSRG